MSFYRKILRPALFCLPAETAHEISIKALQFGLSSNSFQNLSSAQDESKSLLAVEKFGLNFFNPVGMAAGFDKNGIVVNQLASLGFGFVEVGTVTYEPQPGNPKPRMFRLPEDNALINRLGFNNDGAEVVVERLKRLDRKCVVGVNIGRNKDVPNEEATENYLKCFEIIHDVADYVAVNISSPNTPNLRDLQQSESLEQLLGSIQEKNRELSGGNASMNERADIASTGTHLNSHVSARSKPLLMKIAPDLTEAEIEAIVDIALRYEISGIIATNTTISREGLISNVDQIGNGGLSGQPLMKRSNEVISTIFRHSKGELPVIGVGGIFTAEDAFAKIAAGASLIQAYTGFIYGGPSFAGDIKAGLVGMLKERGFSTLDEAVGSAH